MFDIAVAVHLKIALPQELDRQIHWPVVADQAKRDKLQILRRIFVKSFINAIHHGATPVNTESGFQKTGIVPYNPFVPFELQYAMGTPAPQILETIRIGTKVNEKILTVSQGLDFLSRQKYGKHMVKTDCDMNPLRIWHSLKSRHGDEG
jgi:hypothetical protein